MFYRCWVCCLQLKWKVCDEQVYCCCEVVEEPLRYLDYSFILLIAILLYCRYVNVDGVMCLPSPISVTVAIVVITVFTNTTVTAKLGFDSADAQYEVRVRYSKTELIYRFTVLLPTAFLFETRWKNQAKGYGNHHARSTEECGSRGQCQDDIICQSIIFLQPSTVSSPCGGGVTDVLYEWCMPEDAPASMVSQYIFFLLLLFSSCSFCLVDQSKRDCHWEMRKCKQRRR